MPNMYESPLLGEPRIPTLAGAWERLVAQVIDRVLVLCTILPSAVLILALGGGRVLRDRVELQLVVLVPAVALLSVLSLYQWFSTASDGTTIGKRVMGIRIIRDDGEPIDFFHGVLLRSWLFAIGGSVLTVLACGGGWLLTLVDGAMVFSEGRRCLHDRLAGTQVVADD